MIDWEGRTAVGDDLTDRRAESHRKGKSVVSEDDLASLKKLLQTGGQGQLKILSLKKAYPKLIQQGAEDHSMETYRKALAESAWKYQRFTKAPVNSDPDARESFCRTEGRKIAGNTTFTDSKIFPGEPSATSTLPYGWAS